MKVKELIERLQSLDPNLEVYVYNEKESSLFSVDSVRKTCDYGESENGEDEWEDFVTIFPTTKSQSLFTLTAEEVELILPILQNQRNLEEVVLNAFGNKYKPTALEYLLVRIKQWQDENN